MTTQTLSAPGIPARLAAPIGAFLAAVGRAYANSSSVQARLDRVHSLQAMSDAELSRRGISREDIVRHVFADVFAE